MTPSVTAQDLQDMPEYQAAVHALARYKAAQQTLNAWSIVRDENDARTRDAHLIDELSDIKRQEWQALQRAQVDAMQSFSAFVEALVKLLTM